MEATRFNRLFTFGCSFTKFRWETWADILGRQAEFYQNWGRPGGGNQFIFNSIVECNQRQKFTEDDTVIIMWTNVAREDRYVNNEWMTPGNIYSQHKYSNDFVKTFADERGYLIRDLATITATKLLLEQIKCKFIFLSMVPITNINQWEVTPTVDLDVIQLYQTTIDSIRPSVFEVLFDFDWKKFGSHRNLHPITLEHLQYLERVCPEFEITAETREWARLMNDEALADCPNPINSSLPGTTVKREIRNHSSPTFTRL